MLKSLVALLALACVAQAAPPKTTPRPKSLPTQPRRSVEAYGPLQHWEPTAEESAKDYRDIIAGNSRPRQSPQLSPAERKAAAVQRYRAERAQAQRARARGQSTHDAYINQAQEAVRQVQGR